MKFDEALFLKRQEWDKQIDMDTQRKLGYKTAAETGTELELLVFTTRTMVSQANIHIN